MDWQLIDNDAALQALLLDNAQAPAVAVDTEFMRRNTFYPQVALLQLCFGGEAWLIDPLAIDNLDPLRALMTEPAMVKVLHSPSEDLEVFSRWLGALPRPLFDTQRAAALVNRGFGLGYRALVQQICEVDLPKDETRSDWLQRPLSPAQCEYAAQDVVYLLQVYRVLRQQCEDRSRLHWVLADGETAVAALEQGAGPYYPRIKSAWKLDPDALAALVALSEWREQTARDRDKPRSWIIDDQACLAIAQARPRDRNQLRAAVELPPPAARRYTDAILAVLAQQAANGTAPPDPLPAPLSARERELVKRLKKRAREIAEALDIAPEALVQGRDYEALLRQAQGHAIPPPAHWSGWRDEHAIQPLRAALREWLV